MKEGHLVMFHKIKQKRKRKLYKTQYISDR